MTDQTGTPARDMLFYPWGQTWRQLGSNYDTHFAAFQQREFVSGLDPTVFRMYGSRLGRWLSPDPVAGNVMNPQSLNRYAYVLNNPANFTDPQGLDGCSISNPSGCSGELTIHVDVWAPFLPSYLDPMESMYGHGIFYMLNSWGWGALPVSPPEDVPPAPPPPPPAPWDLIKTPKCSDVFSLEGHGYDVTTEFMQVDSLHPSGHRGMDFAAPEGTPIHISFQATVSEETGPAIGFGNVIVLENPTGVPGISTSISFGHGPSPGFVPGQTVYAGFPIGTVGSLGRSTGAHVDVRRSAASVFSGPLLQPCEP